jgi:hypothetical protein
MAMLKPCPPALTIRVSSKSLRMASWIEMPSPAMSVRRTCSNAAWLTLFSAECTSRMPVADPEPTPGPSRVSFSKCGWVTSLPKIRALFAPPEAMLSVEADWPCPRSVT